MFIGLFFFIFGIFIILFPEIIAYMIGFFLIFIGLNIFIFAMRIKIMQRQTQSPESIFSFGGYEFIKRKK